MSGRIPYTDHLGSMRHSVCLLLGAALTAYAQKVVPTPPRVVQKVAPEYSEEARAAGLEGVAALYVEIDEEGNPVVVHVLQGLGMGLDEKAQAAVARWRFEPALTDGRRTRVGIDVEVPFQQAPAGPWQLSRALYRFSNSDRKPDSRSRDLPLLDKPVLAQYTRPDAAACRPGSGVVGVAFVITKDGAVKQARLIRRAENPAADAALRAVESWRFQPGRRNGKAVAATGQIELACGSAQVGPEPPLAVAIGNGVTAPQVRYKIEPEYTEEARRAKHQGKVLLSLEVGPDGYARNIRTLRMLGLGLDEKAIAAVRQWLFAPGLKEGTPVRVQATIEVNFRLL
jgi:TonB family protein